jgi:hypothetical protein
MTSPTATVQRLRDFIENGCDARPEDKHHALQDLEAIQSENMCKACGAKEGEPCRGNCERAMPSSTVPSHSAAELIEDLIERNKEWWRTKSHCAGEMRELGVPDDADATQVTMGDLYQLQKAIDHGA